MTKNRIHAIVLDERSILSEAKGKTQEAVMPTLELPRAIFLPIKPLSHSILFMPNYEKKPEISIKKSKSRCVIM